MNKFKFEIGQKVKIINTYSSYDNTIGTIVYRFCFKSYNNYYVCLGNKKIDDGATIYEKNLILVNRNLLTNE